MWAVKMGIAGGRGTGLWKGAAVVHLQKTGPSDILPWIKEPITAPLVRQSGP